MLRQCYRASKPVMLFSTGMDAITTTHSAILPPVDTDIRFCMKSGSCACLTCASSYKISSVHIGLNVGFFDGRQGVCAPDGLSFWRAHLVCLLNRLDKGAVHNVSSRRLRVLMLCALQFSGQRQQLFTQLTQTQRADSGRAE